jgi:hypothetical protein
MSIKPTQTPALFTESNYKPTQAQTDTAERLMFTASTMLPYVVNALEEIFGPCGVIICIAKAGVDSATVSSSNIADPKLQADMLKQCSRAVAKLTPEQVATQAVSPKGWGPSP